MCSSTHSSYRTGGYDHIRSNNSNEDDDEKDHNSIIQENVMTTSVSRIHRDESGGLAAGQQRSVHDDELSCCCCCDESWSPVLEEEHEREGKDNKNNTRRVRISLQLSRLSIPLVMETFMEAHSTLVSSLRSRISSVVFANIQTRRDGYSFDQRRSRLKYVRKWIPLIIVMLVAINIRQLSDLRHSFYLATLLIARLLATAVVNIAKRRVYAPLQQQQQHRSSFLNNTSDSMLISSYKSGSSFGSSSSMKLMQESLVVSPVSPSLEEQFRDETDFGHTPATHDPSSNSSNTSFFTQSRVDAISADDWGQFTDFDGFDDEDDCFMGGKSDTIATNARMHDDPYFSLTKMIRKRRGDKLSVCKLDILHEDGEGDEEQED
jgi:hypothetical protein